MKYSLGSFKLLAHARGSLFALLSSILIAFSLAPAAAAQTTRTLRVVNTSIERNMNGPVSIEMDVLGNENTFGFSVTFNQAQLTFVSAALGNGVPPGTTLLTNDLQKQNGRVGIAVSLPFGTNIAAGTKQLVVVTFTALTTGASNANVGFGDVPIPREFVTATAEPIPTASVALSPGTVTLFSKGTTVSAASFAQNSSVAPQSIVAVFGPDLATGVQVAGTIPLPTTLLGTTIKVKDSGNMERLAPLFFVSPTQCNYQIPDGTATGTATVTITSSDGKVAIGTVPIANITPGIFTANASGAGVAAAQIYRVRGNDVTIEDVAIYEAATTSFVPILIDMGPAEDALILVLYGTGLRLNSGVSGVTATIGGTAVPVGYAGVAPGYVGLDQINIGPIPRSLAGRGVVNVVITVDGTPANSVTMGFK